MDMLLAIWQVVGSIYDRTPHHNKECADMVSWCSPQRWKAPRTSASALVRGWTTGIQLSYIHCKGGAHLPELHHHTTQVLNPPFRAHIAVESRDPVIMVVERRIGTGRYKKLPLQLINQPRVCLGQVVGTLAKIFVCGYMKSACTCNVAQPLSSAMWCSAYATGCYGTMHAMDQIGETMAQARFAMSHYSQKSDFADAFKFCLARLVKKVLLYTKFKLRLVARLRPSD